MTSKIVVKGVGEFKPTSIEWQRSIYNYSDSAVIKIPHTVRDRNEKITQSARWFKIGMPIDIYCGYDNENDLQFTGFIYKILNNVPVEIHCEGYCYELRRLSNFNRSYSKVTLNTILEDLLKGTMIKIHPFCKNVSLDLIRFKNKTGIGVLDQLKEIGLTTYFIYDTLYVGGLMLAPSRVETLKLNWNTISHELNPSVSSDEVIVNIEYREKDGKKRKITVGNSTKPNSRTVPIKTSIKESKLLREIALQKQREELAQNGSITMFLKPFIEPGITVNVISEKYPEMTGRYFCFSVKGSFSKSGGRQEIKVARI